MKMQLDTENKTISIEKEVSFGEMISSLKKLFPEGQWKEFTLKPFVEVKWSNPVIFNPVRPYYYEYPWWDTTKVICGENMGSVHVNSYTIETTDPDYDVAEYTLNSGTFCIEIK